MKSPRQRAKSGEEHRSFDSRNPPPLADASFSSLVTAETTATAKSAMSILRKRDIILTERSAQVPAMQAFLNSVKEAARRHGANEPDEETLQKLDELAAKAANVEGILDDVSESDDGQRDDTLRRLCGFSPSPSLRRKAAPGAGAKMPPLMESSFSSVRTENTMATVQSVLSIVRDNNIVVQDGRGGEAMTMFLDTIKNAGEFLYARCLFDACFS